MRRFCKKSGVGSSQSGLSIIWLSRSFPISLWCPCRQSRKLKMDKLTHLTRFLGLCVFWGNWICCRSWLKRKNSAQMSTMQWSIRWRNISANAPGAVRKKCGGSGMVDVGKSCSVRTIAQALASLFSARRLSAFLRRWEVSCRWIKKESSDCSAVIEGSLSVATTYSPLFKIPLPSPLLWGKSCSAEHYPTSLRFVALRTALMRLLPSMSTTLSIEPCCRWIRKNLDWFSSIEVLEAWRRPTLPHGSAVPSARPGLTSQFGMGWGGTPAL